MRALLSALAVLTAFTARTALTVYGAHNASAATPLVVLRAACSRPDLHSRVHLPAPATLLSYQETCGQGWEEKVSQRSVSTLSNGGIVEIIGWAGAKVCDCVAATALVWLRAVPAECLRAEAQAAVVLELARRLHWTRVLLLLAPPPHAPPSVPPPRADCEAALAHTAHTLLDAGLLVTRLSLTTTTTPATLQQSDVLIMCVSTAGKIGNDIESLLKDTSAVILLLHFEEIVRVAADFGQEDYKNKERDTSEPIIAAKRKKSSHPTIAQNHIDTKTKEYDNQEHNNVAQIQLGSINILDELQSNQLIVPLDKVHENKQINVTNTTQEVSLSKENVRNVRDVHTSTLSKPKTFTTIKDKVEYLEIFSHFNNLFPGWLLILSDNLYMKEQLTPDTISDEVKRALEKAEATQRSQLQNVQRTFILHIKNNEQNTWSYAATVHTNLTRTLDGTHSGVGAAWSRAVSVRDWSVPAQWNSTRHGEQRAHWGGSHLGGTVAGATGAVLVAAGGALAARWRAVRRRRARRRRDVVLTPQHFTFPTDEARRVPEGMETMLSCWLQQLHEFGGPELERPDLLKRPGLTTHLPSAPSSTCSVNRTIVDRRVRYKGDAVHLKYLPVTGALELKRKSTDVLLLMQNMRQENVNPFIGCLCEGRPALVWDSCSRGSLEDVLMADEIKLDWTFRLSLLCDVVRGMRYVHGSPLRAHGRLSSRNCVVDSRWVLRLTDYSLPAFHRAQGLPQHAPTAREMLWTAPELMREARDGGGWRATQPGDVFSFAIIMQEVIVRGEPYCMLSFTPEELVDKLCRPPPLIRPSVSMGAAPPEAINVMRQCWSEVPDLRPDFNRLHDVFRQMHRGRKINIVDSMFEMLEKYSNNLEELIKERTEQLDMEKKKTEQLLNRMLPRSVAERLMTGSRVEPEEFEEVSIYFSDIVGFTALAARSTAVQVVDLLNDLYTTFDAAIEQYRVYKVETIGDAYMVVGGLPVRTRDHAESVATMALHLLHLAGRFRVRHLPRTPLHLRIGLHTGPCCAGVVGLTMPRYCLFGDTVNTASRMESTGAAWRIQTSAATADRLTAAGGYVLRSRGLTQIKGKGAMHTYWLLGKEGFDRPLPTPPPLPHEGEVLVEVDGESESEGAPPADAATDDQSPTPHTSTEHCRRVVSTATSAESSSPPPHSVRTPLPAPASIDHSAPYARYRWLGGGGGGARTLRRQWSLERGDALAAAAAGTEPPAPRYRTRPAERGDE